MTASPFWRLQLALAKELFNREPGEVLRHASVSRNNAHRCSQCFCCACLTLVENNGTLPIECDEIPY